jgi:hypothetical protein
MPVGFDSPILRGTRLVYIGYSYAPITAQRTALLGVKCTYVSELEGSVLRLTRCSYDPYSLLRVVPSSRATQNAPSHQPGSLLVMNVLRESLVEFASLTSKRVIQT